MLSLSPLPTSSSWNSLNKPQNFLFSTVYAKLLEVDNFVTPKNKR